MASLTPLQSRDLGVTVYTLAVFFQGHMLVRNAYALATRRKSMFYLSTALCVFGLAAALSAYFYSTAWTDITRTCSLRHPINSSFHLLALTCSDLIHLYKMQVVNSGQERRIFLVIGTLFLLFRLSSSVANSVLSSSQLTPSGTCATKFNATSNVLLNISITCNNVVLGAMFIYPLRRHIGRMSGFPTPSSHTTESAKKKSETTGGGPKPAKTLIQKLVSAGLKWAILSSVISTVTYALIASNVLGPLTGALVYIDWVFMTYCATEMLHEKPGGSNQTTTSNSGVMSASRPTSSKV